MNVDGHVEEATGLTFSEDVDQIAAQYLNDKITTNEEALSGARDIIAELINENDIVRAKMRLLFE